ncbi:Rpusd2 [Symbiodinium sp. KB8]|nr:Rpusd2 [Symbiodinium sp. KB8]
MSSPPLAQAADVTTISLAKKRRVDDGQGAAAAAPGAGADQPAKPLSKKQRRAARRAARLAEAASAAGIAADSTLGGNLVVKRVSNIKRARRQYVGQHETAYYQDAAGLRRVHAYTTVLRTFCKERWAGQDMLDIFQDEFHASSAQFYADALAVGAAGLGGIPGQKGTVMKNGDYMANRVVRLEPPVPNIPLKIVAFAQVVPGDHQVAPASAPASQPDQDHGQLLADALKYPAAPRAERSKIDAFGTHLQAVEPGQELKASIVAAAAASAATGCLDSTSPHTVQGVAPAPRRTITQDTPVGEHPWDVIVVNKPPGVSVHFGGAYKYNTVAMLLAHTLQLPVTGMHSAHRLDRPTSGCLLMARDSPGGRGMTRMIENGLLTKYYVAKVRGVFPAPGGGSDPPPTAPAWLAPHVKTAWVHPSTRDVPGDKPHLPDEVRAAATARQPDRFTCLGEVYQAACEAVSAPVVAASAPPQWLSVVAPIARTTAKFGNMCVGGGGKFAQSRFVRLAVIGPDGQHLPSDATPPAHQQDECMSLVLCQPMTGRTHQLRVHLQALGFPIWNDPVYCVPATAMTGPEQQVAASAATLHGTTADGEAMDRSISPDIAALCAAYDWRRRNELYQEPAFAAAGLPCAPVRRNAPFPFPPAMLAAARQRRADALARGRISTKVQVAAWKAGNTTAGEGGALDDEAFLAPVEHIALLLLRSVLVPGVDVPVTDDEDHDTQALLAAPLVEEWWTKVPSHLVAQGDDVDFSPAQLHCGGIWLHSWRYEGPSWHFSASLPPWGQPGGTQPAS